MKLFYEPRRAQLKRLHGSWSASYSGGKDSTSLVVWLEWLRRTGWIDMHRPQLVQSDTTVEEQCLQAVSLRMMDALTKSGWECIVVRPEVHERLYNQILGRGLPPIHPGVRRMRWCTRSTKIDPMTRQGSGAALTLTGLRLGESAIRDGKILKAMGCAAGGECGIPDPGKGRYSPLLHWSTCHVVDWLSGAVSKRVREALADLLPITRSLLEIYAIEKKSDGFDFAEPEYKVARFGCIGCPAICADSSPPRSVILRNGNGSPLNELYAVWHEARLRVNRLVRIEENGKETRGPIKMAARKRLFERVMDIQRRAGVVLIAPEDEAFIRACWESKVYPQRWSEADEQTTERTPLFVVETR